jgi:BlaI family transcriptional regulator, penicillinase repressor
MAGALQSGGPRHSILDLAPLELDCMNALWPAGEATVRDIQQALYPTRPRAYTTIMTILDRLAQKGIVLRRKSGRAWVYQPILTAEEARSQALAQLVDGFFAGSSEGLAKHLAAQGEVSLAGDFRTPGQQSDSAPLPAKGPSQRTQQAVARPARDPEKPADSGLDASLL